MSWWGHALALLVEALCYKPEGRGFHSRWDHWVSQLRGRAIAQALSRSLPTAAARIRARVRSCGICGGQSGTGAGFLRVLPFPLPNFIPPVAPQSPSSIIWGWYNRPVVAAVPSRISLTPLKIIKKNITWPNPSSRTMALGSTQPLTGIFLGGKGRPARKADITADCLENVGATTSHNSVGLHGLLQG
jgi:hypothetical protein